MIISSPLPRGRQPTFHQGSGLRSPRDADATARQWLRAKTANYNSGGTDRQMFFMLQKLSRQRKRIVGGGGSTTSTGLVYKGEYNGGAYDTQNVVEFTPDGASPGFYLALKPVPAGQSPDVGFPYWKAFPAPAPGQWA